MCSVTYSLGELEHVYNECNLKLVTNGSVTFSSPQAFVFPFSVNFTDLDTLISSNIWVSGGHQLRIHATIFFGEIAVRGLSQSNILEQLGALLCKAEV